MKAAVRRIFNRVGEQVVDDQPQLFRLALQRHRRDIHLQADVFGDHAELVVVGDVGDDPIEPQRLATVVGRGRGGDVEVEQIFDEFCSLMLFCCRMLTTSFCSPRRPPTTSSASSSAPSRKAVSGVFSSCET